MTKNLKIMLLVLCFVILTACGGGSGGGGDSTPEPKAACSFQQFIYYRDYFGGFNVRGIIKNSGNATAVSVKVTVECYDAGGIFLGSVTDYVDGYNIPAGGTSTFDSKYSSVPASQVATYRRKITWR